jgi:hypothetical protein
MMQNPASGYSATPLVKKLGIKPGMHLVFMQPPAGYCAALATQQSFLYQDPVLHCQSAADEHTDWVQLFVTERAQLAVLLQQLRICLKPDAVIWVSWPKQAAKQPTDIRENDIRDIALPLGFVDIKVCAVDAVWSGLKLMLRRELR